MWSLRLNSKYTRHLHSPPAKVGRLSLFNETIHSACPVSSRKVSSLEALEAELIMPSAEIAVKIEELETRGAFQGIMIDDARGESGRSFVRVDDDEMRALAAITNQRGRLTVADFAAEANRVLQLSDGGEEATRAGRNRPEGQHMLGCEAGTEAPSDRCPKDEEISEFSAIPRRDDDTPVVVRSSLGAESSGRIPHEVGDERTKG